MDSMVLDDHFTISALKLAVLNKVPDVFIWIFKNFDLEQVNDAFILVVKFNDLDLVLEFEQYFKDLIDPSYDDYKCFKKTTSLEVRNYIYKMSNFNPRILDLVNTETHRNELEYYRISNNKKSARS